MRNNLIAFLPVLTFTMILHPTISIAGSAQIAIDCESKDHSVKIQGYVPGDSPDYDVSIQINNQKTRFVDACADAACSKYITNNKLLITEAIKNKVFVLNFFDIKKDEIKQFGYFYAIPSTIKYQENENGYRATYTAIFYGDILKNNNSAIKLNCKHTYEI